MTKQQLYEFVRHHKLAVVASVSQNQRPESALVGIAVTPDLELIFDTIETTRKCKNLRACPRASFVIGWDNETTVQYEGLADEPRGGDLDRCKRVYFGVYPDGPERERWPGITYFRVRPTWVRYSNFNEDPPRIFEISI
jgi:hypothetical protein